jgi:hypothetical protein
MIVVTTNHIANSNLESSYITYLSDKEGGEPAKAPKAGGAGFPFIFIYA